MTFDRRVLAGLAAPVAVIAAIAAPAMAAPVVGQPAPAFTAVDADGHARSLSEFRGKTVVLEWTNNGCPYVQKHYNSGHMQGLQKEATREGVVWLTLISSSEGTQGYVTPPQADELTTSRKAAPTAVLLDSKGVAGKLYGATNTPHMYVVDKAGMLVYAGAIDDRPTSRRADVPGANNYVRAALDAVAAGQPVKTPITRAYGCTVKYS
jgi:hypothetical protein